MNRRKKQKSEIGPQKLSSQKQKMKRLKKNEQNIWELWDTNKRINMTLWKFHKTGEKGAGRIFEEIMSKTYQI